MKSIYQLFILVGISALISGCMTEKEIMIKEGYPLAYVDGFDDGCHSGRSAGGSNFDRFKKDINRFEKEAKYAQGWSDAFRQCETEEEANTRRDRIIVEQQRLTEERRRNDWQEQRDLDRGFFKGVDARGWDNSLRR
jgi:hypothetical protein